MKATILASAACLLLGGAAPAAEPAQYQALLEQKAAAIVTVRVVLKTEMNFGGQGRNTESREEVQGVVVSGDGLILTSYDTFRSEEDEGGEFHVKRVPQEIKIVFEDEEKEYDAEIVATDKKVNLAFLKVKDLEGRTLAPVSFAEPTTVEVGAEVVAVSRLAKGYDYAPYVRTGRVSGTIRKPRKALILEGAIHGEGLPVYTPAGEVIGVLTSIESGLAEESSGRGGFFRLFSSSGDSFVLPGKVVARLIEQAARQAEEQAKKNQDGDAAAPEAEDAGDLEAEPDQEEDGGGGEDS